VPIKRHFVFCLAVWIGWSGLAAELRIDFSETPAGQTPAGFRSVLSGHGKPGEWKIVLDDVASMFPPLSPGAPSTAKKAVLGQLAQDITDERFPMLLYEKETFGDFTFTTRFKTVSGKVEQMAGIVFRVQNETNFYVVRASSLGNTFRFYKVVNGERGTILGPEIPIPSGTWHEMAVECKGNKIRCLLNGNEAIPTITDSSFTSGKVGFWTKSDSVSYFSDARITYTPREIPAQVLLRNLVEEYPRLVNVQIFVAGKEPGTTRLIASKNAAEVGQPGGSIEQDTIANGNIYYGKEKGTVSVVMPLRDRNGDCVAAMRVVMKSFAGQTEANAIVRATPIVKEIQGKIQNLVDLVE
jgi:hypothetical protein